MIRTHFSLATVFAVAVWALSNVNGFTLSMTSDQSTASSRRAFMTKGAATVASAALVATSSPQSALAAPTAPTINNTPNGIKYATLKKPEGKATRPQEGDIVALEYTGYLTSGQVRSP